MELSNADRLRVAELVAMQCVAQAPRFRLRGDEIIGRVYLRILAYIAKLRRVELSLDRYVVRCCHFEIPDACFAERIRQGAAWEGEVVEGVPRGWTTTLDDLIAREDMEHLRDAISSLPETLRRVLAVFFSARPRDRSVQHLARQLGCSRQQIYRVKNKALAAIRKSLRPGGA